MCAIYSRATVPDCRPQESHAYMERNDDMIGTPEPALNRELSHNIELRRCRLSQAYYLKIDRKQEKAGDKALFRAIPLSHY